MTSLNAHTHLHIIRITNLWTKYIHTHTNINLWTNLQMHICTIVFFFVHIFRTFVLSNLQFLISVSKNSYKREIRNFGQTVVVCRMWRENKNTEEKIVLCFNSTIETKTVLYTAPHSTVNKHTHTQKIFPKNCSHSILFMLLFSFYVYYCSLFWYRPHCLLQPTRITAERVCAYDIFWNPYLTIDRATNQERTGVRYFVYTILLSIFFFYFVMFLLLLENIWVDHYNHPTEIRVIPKTDDNNLLNK